MTHKTNTIICLILLIALQGVLLFSLWHTQKQVHLTNLYVREVRIENTPNADKDTPIRLDVEQEDISFFSMDEKCTHPIPALPEFNTEQPEKGHTITWIHYPGALGATTTTFYMCYTKPIYYAK